METLNLKEVYFFFTSQLRGNYGKINSNEEKIHLKRKKKLIQVGCLFPNFQTVMSVAYVFLRFLDSRKQ